MTTKDSAGDKLVATIRKTKTAAKASTKTTTRKSAKKTAKPSSNKASGVKATNTTANRKKQLVDLFQSGRRVWPD
jgi:hypothetical protein